MGTVPILVWKIGTVPIYSCPDGIPLRLPRVPVEHLQEPLAPRVERIIRLEQPCRRHAARPLERAEENVVGVARPVAAEERVLHKHGPQRIERRAKRGERALRILPELLQPHAIALLARLAEVGLVLGMDLVEEVEN